MRKVVRLISEILTRSFRPKYFKIMNYRIYKNGDLYSEYEETSYGYRMAINEFQTLKKRHKKDGTRITLCGVFGDILADTKI